MGLNADLFVANNKCRHIETIPKFEFHWWLSCQYDTISRNVAMFFIDFYNFFENPTSLIFYFLVKALIFIPPKKDLKRLNNLEHNSVFIVRLEVDTSACINSGKKKTCFSKWKKKFYGLSEKAVKWEFQYSFSPPSGLLGFS